MRGTTYPYPHKVACDECGQLHRYQPVMAGQHAACQRCGAILYRNRPYMLDACLALSVTGLILFALSNAFPLLGLRAQGAMQEISLWKACFAFWQQDYPLLAILLTFTVLIFPLFDLCALLWVMLTIQFHWSPRFALWLFRWMRELKPWGMLEIFMLGILVAVVKLGDVAILIIGPAFWSFSCLIVCMAAAGAILDPFTVWNQLSGYEYDE